MIVAGQLEILRKINHGTAAKTFITQEEEAIKNRCAESAQTRE